MGAAKKKSYASARNYVAVGKLLQEARLRSGLTQKEVSDDLGYSSGQFISNFECGMAVPPLKKLRRLIELYKINPKELLDVILDAERVVMMAGIAGKNRAK